MGLDSRNATENPRISSSKKGLIRADPDPHSPRTYLLAAFYPPHSPASAPSPQRFPASMAANASPAANLKPSATVSFLANFPNALRAAGFRIPATALKIR